jgi:signal transduction histidine kinase/ActR/RegA family two-component response regulator
MATGSLAPTALPHRPTGDGEGALLSRAWRRATAQAFRRSWRRLALFALAYAALSWVSLRVVAGASNMTPMWPPAGLMAAGLLFLDSAPLWMVFLAAFVGQRLSVNPFAIPSAGSLVLVGAACLEGWLARVVIRHVSGGIPRFSRVRDALALLVGALVAVVLSGLVAGLVRADSVAAFRHSFVNWTIGGGLGILMVTSFLLAWLLPRPEADLPLRRHGVEVSLFLAVTAATTTAAFMGLSLADGVPVRPYALIGPLVWGALRFGARGITLAMLLITVVAAPLQLVSPTTVLGGDTPEARLLRLQLFLAFMAVTGLILASALSEQRAAAEAERRAVEAMLESERRLLQSQKLEAVGQLAGGVAHDFNNILAAMSLQVQELRTAPRLAGGEGRTVEELQEAVHRAAALTRQLLLFSRRQVREDRFVDLGALVASMGRMLGRLLPESIALEMALPEGPVAVQGDHSMLEQVVMNLVVNARDALPRGGTVRVTLARERLGAPDGAPLPPSASGETLPPGPYAVLRVQDNGVGIPEAHQRQLFEPFFTTKPPGEGTGLGLSTVFGIARQHHGYVRLVSSSAAGTCFEFGIPALTAAAPHQGADAEAPAPSRDLPLAPVATPPAATLPRDAEASPASVTILLVEDDAGVRRMIERLLRREGWAVVVAENAAEVLARWDQLPPVDLVITDLVLTGGMGGVELAAELLARVPSLRVLYTSGYDPGYGEHGVEMIPGVNFVAKPFSASALLDVVRRHMAAPP